MICFLLLPGYSLYDKLFLFLEKWGIMAKIHCKMCGGQIDLQSGMTSGECPYCGSLTTFPKIDTPQREQLYNRAEHFRQVNNFDKAVSSYEAILNIDSEDPEAWWGLLISKYGIEYVEDPVTHERIPTCHRVQYESILADPDYLNALKYAVGYDRDIYEKEARRISEIQKNILRISAQEKPYDVFICYKETTDGGTRTRDSVLAQDIYFQLTKQGLKVFFSRITLENKLGQQYEPYIFAALNSAKVMLVIGSRREYFDAVWVKNEWSRFLALKKNDSSKLLIPCYRDMDAYDIPEELAMFQSQDMNKIGFMQDLLYGIMKVVGAGRNEAKKESADTDSSISDIDNVKKRIAILVSQDDWEKAVSYCERRLDTNPEDPELYFLICMLSRRIPDEETLRNSACSIQDDTNFRIALKYASPERRRQLESIRQETQTNCFLKKCLDANGVSDMSKLYLCRKPLIEDADFRAALEIAPPERKKELQKIQYDQADYMLEGIKQKYRVSELKQVSIPLSTEPDFCRLLNMVSPERRAEMEESRQQQCEFFVGRCLAANRLYNEADLALTLTPLAENVYFKIALLCASPERQKTLQKLQQDQAEFFVRKCMETNHVSSEADLPGCPKPLNEDDFFMLAFKYASLERRVKLERIREAQSDTFLRKCMEACHVKDPSELANCTRPLLENLNFRLARTCALPAQEKVLDQIVSSQQLRIAARKLKRFAVVAGCVLVLVVLVVILWSNRLKIGATLGGAEAKYRLALRYETGDGVEKSIYEAERWYRKAAKSGHAEAQYRLAQRITLNSSGVFSPKAIEWCRKAAEQGHVLAQYVLGLSYEKGYGVTRDFSEAFTWYRKAAEQGHAEAQYKAGLFCETGNGTTQDYAEAVKWYRLAVRHDNAEASKRLPFAELVMNAQNGNANAQYKLAQAYEAGDGVEKSNAEALKWYRKAAEQGHAEAQCKAGLFYETGKGTTQDYAEAVKWYRLAVRQGKSEASKRLPFAELVMNAQAGNADAQYKLAQAYENGNDVEKSLSRAFSWYRKAAEQGHAEAQYHLALAYEAGKSTTQDYAEAIAWYLKAAKSGHAEAQYRLALAYETGNGVEKSLSEANVWYRKAANQGNEEASRRLPLVELKYNAQAGNADAQYKLALAYENGDGMEKDPSEAVQWFRKAAEQGHAESQYRTGLFCADNGVQDLSEAATWLRKAVAQGHVGASKILKIVEMKLSAQAGNADAQYELAQAYETGNGLEKDPSEAFKWYLKAAEQGHPAAQYQLGVCYDSGSIVARNPAESIAWFTKAANQGYVEAQYRLGQAYETGRNGIEKNFLEAQNWYRRAAESGHAGAKAGYTRLGPVEVGASMVTVSLPSGLSWKMIKVEAGSFRMSVRDERNSNSDEIEHGATLTRDFYIGQTEVTQAQWRAVMGNNPSHFPAGGDARPVESVSWNDAMAFCNALNRMGKAPSGWTFSLPTETQWEYAARGGRLSRGYLYSGSNELGEVAYCGFLNGPPDPVAGKKSNELGLYDMNGNVWEWCLDDWVSQSNRLIAEFSSSSSSGGTKKAHRGGSWFDGKRFCRPSARDSSPPEMKSELIGFRLALVPESY